MIFFTLLVMSTKAYSNALNNVCPRHNYYFDGWKVESIASLSNHGSVLVKFFNIVEDYSYRLPVSNSMTSYYYSIIQTAHELDQKVNVCIDNNGSIVGIEVTNSP